MAREANDNRWEEAWNRASVLKTEIDADQETVRRLIEGIRAKQWQVAALLSQFGQETAAPDARAGSPEPTVARPQLAEAKRTDVQQLPKPTSKIGLEGKTRKERVLKALYRFGRPAAARDIADLLGDDYTGIYNALNDMRRTDVYSKALTLRHERLWSLTADGRKEAERIGGTAA